MDDVVVDIEVNMVQRNNGNNISLEMIKGAILIYLFCNYLFYFIYFFVLEFEWTLIYFFYCLVGFIIVYLNYVLKI